VLRGVVVEGEQFLSAADLAARCHRAAIEGRWAYTMRFYGGPTLLVIDELGYLPLPAEAASGHRTSVAADSARASSRARRASGRRSRRSASWHSSTRASTRVQGSTSGTEPFGRGPACRSPRGGGRSDLVKFLAVDSLGRRQMNPGRLRGRLGRP
jgi:IstB-like ATP binding protein